MKARLTLLSVTLALGVAWFGKFNFLSSWPDGHY
jgi:hypothetical protein